MLCDHLAGSYGRTVVLAGPGPQLSGHGCLHRYQPAGVATFAFGRFLGLPAGDGVKAGGRQGDDFGGTLLVRLASVLQILSLVFL